MIRNDERKKFNICKIYFLFKVGAAPTIYK